MSKLTGLDATKPQAPAAPDASIARVLAEVAMLGQKAIEHLTPRELRQQPAPTPRSEVGAAQGR